MTFISKKQKAYADKVEQMKLYSLSEAVSILKGIDSATFDESIEVALNLGVDPKYNDQVVRGSVALPHGTGKTVRVAVIAKADAADEAQKAGADVVGAEDLVEKIQKGFLDFDKLVATPDCMPLVGRIGKILGPKGLMPNPKVGTVTPKPGNAVKALKAGMIEFKVEKNGIVHAGVGRKSFEAAQIEENIKALVDAIKSAKPTGVKGTYMQRMAISSTMGPGVKIDLNTVN